MDLRKENLNWNGSGEVYFRLCQCLYRNYAERTGKQFVNREFLKAMAKIGKLAWAILVTKCHLLRRNEVIKEVGPEALEFGFLIGHEDCRLFGDETSDIFITFLHRSLQEFLGAFFFVWALSSGKSAEELIGIHVLESPLLNNPLVLEFCMWFLTQPGIFPDGIKQALRITAAHVSVQINHVQLDFSVISSVYPIIEFFQSKFKFSTSFFDNV